jgi:hypothetical protein
MKIFLIGFNKCGTTTIHRYFAANGIRSVHWDKGRLAKRVFHNIARGDPLLAGYENFDAFTDMEYLDDRGAYHLEAYKLFPYLAAQYPDAVFILNTRDREAWIRSRLRQPNYAARARKHHRVASDKELADIWRADWDHHHRRVTEFFSRGTYRFLVCHIETDLPHLLEESLPECNLDSRFYKIYKGNRTNSLLLRKWLRRRTRPLRRSVRSLFHHLLRRTDR